MDCLSNMVYQNLKKIGRVGWKTPRNVINSAPDLIQDISWE